MLLCSGLYVMADDLTSFPIVDTPFFFPGPHLATHHQNETTSTTSIDSRERITKNDKALIYTFI